MAVRIGNKFHANYQADRSGEGLWITACGRVDDGPHIEEKVTCELCLKAMRSIVDPDKVKVPKLTFGKPETGDQFREAVALRKSATKAVARLDGNRQSLEWKLSDIRTRIKHGTLANRCHCGKFPWEHTLDHECGPRNAYRRWRLLKLYMHRPLRSLKGSNIGRLRTLGFVEYPDTSSAVASKLLFFNSRGR